MKIVYVVPVLAPYAIPRFQELAKINNVEVHVIVEKATSSDRIGWKFERIEGVTTHLVDKNYSHKFVKINKNGNYSQNEEHIFSFDLKRIVKRIDPDVVIVCNSSQLLMLLGPRKYKLGVIVEDTLRANEGRKKINRFVKKMLLNTADFYCPFSDESVKYLNSFGIYKSLIKTSWSINNADFTDLSKQELDSFKINKDIDCEKTNFFIVANLIKLKGILEFLDSWLSLPSKVLNNSSLYIAGEGPLKKTINEKLSLNKCSNVKVLGHVSYDDIKKYLQAMDVFVLPTLEDLNSLAVFEALAAKKPLLISKFTGNSFLVKEGGNGFLFDPYSVGDTTSKIIKLLNCNLDNLSKKSARISELYTNNVVMNKFYNDLIKLLYGRNIVFEET